MVDKSVLSRALNTPTNESSLIDLADNIPSADLLEVSRELDAIAQKASVLSAYLSRRALGQTSRPAVEHSNRVLRKVRKALGFTYP